MKTLLSFFFVFTLQACIANAQQSILSRETFVGNWTEYRIDSTEKYLAIPDSLKGYDTLKYPLAFWITNTYEFHADGTYGYFVGLSGVEIGWEGTWNVSNDTLILVDEYKATPGYIQVRYISPRKIELMSSEMYDGELVRTYWFLEKQ